ncbi:MAG: NUDIX domain-containing protein [Pikeienuella sp.]
MNDDDFILLGEWEDDTPNHGALILPIDEQGRYLLQLRDHNPDAIYPGLWGLFGGKAEADETLPEIAVREFEEETGLVITADQLRPFARIFSRETRAGRGNWRLYCYTMEFRGEARDIRLGEGAGFGFIRPEDVNELAVVPFVTKVINALKNVR